MNRRGKRSACPTMKSSQLEPAAGRQRGQRLQLHRRTVALHFKKNLALRSNGPKAHRLVRHAEFVTGMVLWETAICVRMRAAAGAGAQIRNQLVQLHAAASRFDPDEDIAGRRSYEQIEVVGGGAMLVATRLQADMAPQPAAVENEPGRSCELADIFPEKPNRIMRKDAVGSSRLFGRQPGRQEFALDLAALIGFEKIFLQTSPEKFLLPGCERWTNTQAGWIGPLSVGCADSVEFVLQPRLEMGVQRCLGNSERYRVAAPHWLGLSAATRPKL
jgi:hypothetical protein